MVTAVKVITKHEVARREAGLTITELSRRAGVDHAYVSRIEAGLVPASHRYQQRFAGACGIDPSDVFDPESGRALPAFPTASAT